tara:strand:- start:265676 stop:268063 length:2388 start_codon:yes stop_codon:yes gene_type:complete
MLLMIQKLLKSNLWLLCVLAFFNIVYYAFYKNFPDNTLTISSSDNDLSYFSYYVSSLFTLSSYYVGVWIVAPFVTYFFIYNTVLNKRHKEFDLFIPFLLCGFFFSLSFIFFPEFIGKGLLHKSDKVLDSYIVFFMVLLFGFFVALVTMRSAFWDSLSIMQTQLGQLGGTIGRYLNIAFKHMEKTIGTLRSKSSSVELKTKAIGFLKTGIKRPNTEKLLPRNTKKLTKATAERKDREISTPVKNDPASKIVEENNLAPNPQMPAVEEKKEEVVAENNIQDSGDSKKQIKSSVGSMENESFFQSEELIDCISDNTNHERIQGPDKHYFDSICSTIEGKLNEFNVRGQIINILKGPVVDTFELDLGEGIKASKVKGLEDDIGLALNGAPIRVVYPLKGRSTIGIEVPRNPREFIYLDEVLQTPVFNESNNRLPIAMGKDAFGEVAVVDLAGMPHMLVAGATGAGKSVFINTLLVSLIIKKSPKELKLVLIDPKQLELALFSTLPHLMLPVITEAKSAAISLLWAVEEMERRYTILKEMGVKNIEGFNKKLKAAGPSILWKISQYYENGDEEGYELPYIVIVIDEFADLILTKSGKDIETNVNRLAAKARAAGIHLVLATQRPSTDVITGVIKANFPTRVAFRVTTGHDSKTILDQYGAQKLLGKGDMLYKHGVELLRLHSSFVDEGEIEVLVEKLSEIPSEFNEEAIKFLETGGEEDPESNGEVTSGGTYVSGTSDDPVYQEALQVVMESGQASASMLQRRLRVGYNRAANIIDELERNGIVGPAQGSKPRKVLARPD